MDELLDSTQNQGLKDAEFRHGARQDSIFLVCIKTPGHQHLYQFLGPGSHAPNTARIGPWIRELASFSVTREISAIDAGRGPGNTAIYIAFKNGGIRKFGFPRKLDQDLREETSFFERSRGIVDSEIRSIIFGSAVSMPAVYATTGDDGIFRFAVDGTADYGVE